jgi:ATP-dependent RNA helicase DeaD
MYKVGGATVCQTSTSDGSPIIPTETLLPLPRLATGTPLEQQRPDPPQITSFRQLDLSRTMLAALKRAEYEKPTPIQAGLIPRALEEVDIVGQARTGTGKTAAFVIPIIECMDDDDVGTTPQALVLVPTRELAVQVCGEVEKLAYGRKIRSIAVYGGTPLRKQIETLRRGTEVVVGTPGRVLDLMRRRVLDLGDVWCVVLDEADRMLDIGFRPDIERILKMCPRDRQTLLLSATVPPPIKTIAQRYMRNPESLDFSEQGVSVDTIEQHYFTVADNRKFELLVRLMDRENPKQSIVFCRTKRGTDSIYRRLSKRRSGVACIHGDMDQRSRDSTMKKFRAGEISCLVATDIVGRGIDVSGVSHIINYDVPQFCDDYVHRVGRTGRMGREGIAFSFVTPEQGHELTRIEQRINRQLKRDDMEGFASESPLVSVPGLELAPDGSPAEALRLLRLTPCGVRRRNIGEVVGQSLDAVSPLRRLVEQLMKLFGHQPPFLGRCREVDVHPTQRFSSREAIPTLEFRPNWELSTHPFLEN